MNFEQLKADSEYRPCIVKGQRALFHMWEENAVIYAPSPMVGGHGGGVARYTLAIVEYEDGHVERIRPEEIVFVDNRIKEYYFPNQNERGAKGNG